MPTLERGDVSLYYEEHGRGFPLLLLAPGGMRSRLAFWGGRADSWFNPMTKLADEFRVIGMDQRNAGRSVGPIGATESRSYLSFPASRLNHGFDFEHTRNRCYFKP